MKRLVPGAKRREWAAVMICIGIIYLTAYHSSSELHDVNHHLVINRHTEFEESRVQNKLARPSPTYVLLMAYQRSGSSFLGELFNHNPDAVYMFEPGDGIYASMYSTVQDWNTRDDITNNHNGTRRTIPEIEIRTVVEKMNSIYKCRYQDLPAELLIHDFFELFIDQMQALREFNQCANKIINSKHLKYDCFTLTQSECPQRLGDDNEKAEVCRDMLQPNATHRSDAIQQYMQCNKQLKDATHQCVQDASDMCDNRPIRVAKTVRVSMEMVEALLKVIPDLKIIHYFRDPRPVSISRQLHATLRGTYAEFGADTLLKSAHLYCQDVYRDLQHRVRLEQKYPATFLEVYFEELALHPHSTATKIYQFLDLKLPVGVTRWLEDHTQSNNKGVETTRNSRDIVYAWTRKINSTVLQNINRRCAGLYRIISKPHLWPNNTVT